MVIEDEQLQWLFLAMAENDINIRARSKNFWHFIYLHCHSWRLILFFQVQGLLSEKVRHTQLDFAITDLNSNDCNAPAKI